MIDSCKNNKIKCSESENFANLCDMLSIVSQENRLQIICLLNKKFELCVCEIIEQLGLKQNLVSHHLMMLKNIGIIKRRKDGKNVYYSINQEYYDELIKQIKHVFNIN